jgi:hypothetical protein
MAEGIQTVATEAGTEHAATTEAHGGAVHGDPTALG